MNLIISPSGECRCIYDEAIDFEALGNVEIKRASHVEPTEHGTWQADLSPVGGPVLGPFARRSEALRAEITWLEDWLINPTENHS